MTFPEPTNITRPFQLFGYANNLTSGLFGSVIVVMIFIIAFISMKNYKTSQSFAAAAFITLIPTILLRTMSIISDFVLIVVIIMSAFGLFLLMFEDKWS